MVVKLSFVVSAGKQVLCTFSENFLTTFFKPVIVWLWIDVVFLSKFYFNLYLNNPPAYPLLVFFCELWKHVLFVPFHVCCIGCPKVWQASTYSPHLVSTASHTSPRHSRPRSAENKHFKLGSMVLVCIRGSKSEWVRGNRGGQDCLEAIGQFAHSARSSSNQNSCVEGTAMWKQKWVLLVFTYLFRRESPPPLSYTLTHSHSV